MKFYTLKVINICFETKDCVTILFKQPALKHISYLAGQYLSLILHINGRRYVRPYSLSSAPGVDTTLNITVKRMPGGIVSNHIIDKLSIGDIIEVMEPMGDFTITDLIDADANLFLWGAGSGITPLISILKYALHGKKCRHITLVYGNRDFNSVIFNKKINDLKTQYHEALSVWHFHSRLEISKTNLSIVHGRINPEKVLKVLKEQSDIINTIHYICGPQGLKDSIKKVLGIIGIDNNNIFTENFVITRNPEEFENIKTRDVILKRGGQTNKIEVIKGKSVLEAGLDCLIDLPYSCQTGNCLICKGRLIKGGVKMIGLQKKPDELKPDEYLLCCTFPLNDEVEFNIQ